MSFKDLSIKKSYINQGNDNMVDSLLNPALRLSVKYRRSVGYFSSSVFKLIINALPDFIKNNGKIDLIVSPTLSADDVSAIELGYEKKEELLNKRFISEFSSEIRCFDDRALNILSELVARGILDIKVASVKNRAGIYHDKLGILTDKEGNNIVFYGSANSSINAYQNNYEKIRVVRSWEPGEGESVFDEVIEFDRLWQNKNKYLEVFDFMKSVKNCILEVRNEREHQKSTEPISLFDYQKEAINSWVSNGYKGFYVMATGTGKTWTAIYSAKALVERHEKCLIVIAAPYKHLVRQWEEDVKKAFPSANIVLISSENPQWENISKRFIIAQKYANDKQIILITTIKSFYSDRFEALISKSDENKLLIVDEAHRFTNRPESLHATYKYMLGLSATPINGKNNEAGIDLVNFFGGQVFNLPIEDALEKGFLVPYYYHPIFIAATDEEEESFNQISSKMAACYKDGILIDKDALIKYSRSRLRILSMAEAKISSIRNLLNSVKVKDHFVVYCGDGRLFDEQSEAVRYIQFVKQHLDSMGIKTSQFTASENMDRRMELVDMFNRGQIDSLVAIRCLDEGINIPSIKSALILSSNDDYREFVQRRGRILRKYNGKRSADIYDVIVLPSTNTPKIAQIELRRYNEYAKLALNKADRLHELYHLLDYYHLKQEDIEFDTEIDTEADLDE